MSCEKCTTTPNIPSGRKRIVVFASTDHILNKIYMHLSPLFEIRKETDHLICEAEFETFLKTIANLKDFTEIEIENITIIPLDLEKSLTYSSLTRVKTLEYWINLYFASDLKWILDNSTIKMFFQPIVDLHTYEIVAHECLARGMKSDGSIMPPNVMFNMARKTEMLFNLDRLCRLQAIKQSKEKDIHKGIFINFTPNSIYNPEFCLKDTVKWAKDLSMDFSKVTFEVVESEKVVNIKHLKDILTYYRKMGFKVALDDLGSGYSSLNMLAELNPDVIKIDRKLIENIHNDPTKEAIVKSLLKIGEKIGAKVLAEGIETKEEADLLKELGVNLGQGYYFLAPQEEPAKKIFL